jgi:hypothetical protein
VGPGFCSAEFPFFIAAVQLSTNFFAAESRRVI